MCGIAGALNEVGAGSAVDLITRVVVNQYRRGPDHQTVEEIKSRRSHVTFGHNRLSIIDLSPAGYQPMWDVDRSLCLVHNGEIYNYVELRDELEARGHHFRSKTDTEVVLEAFKEWGPEAFARFNGMFAFALFDLESERLHLVRDRFGVKPLYYAVSEKRLVFASTPTIIARDLGLSPNLEYVSRGLEYEVYEDGELAPFTNMKALAPGHYLEARVEDGSITLRSHAFYGLSDRVSNLVDSLAGLSIPRLVEIVNEAIEDAVRIRLRADVPVGIALSGGLDSSTIAAVSAVSHGLGVRAFTFGDPVDGRSEGPLAQQLSDMARLEVCFAHPERTDPVKVYFDTLQAQGAPFASTSQMAQFLVYQTAQEAGLKVLLGGQGGDEVFMGYRKFYVFRFQHLLRKRRYPEALGCGLRLAQMAFAELPRARTYWEASRRYRAARRRSSILRLPWCDALPLCADPDQPPRQRQVDDVTRWSLPTLLRYEDRNSMGNSIESRLPFMDYRLVELGLALPDTVKVRQGYGKWIVREAMRGRIPEPIRAVRWKRGFDVANQDEWISQGLGAAIREAIRARKRAIDEWLVPGIRLEEAFSDEALKWRPECFTAATTLIWLGDCREVTAA